MIPKATDSSLTARSLTISEHRSARTMAYANGGLWAIGNGLASTLLVIHLALDLNSESLGMGIGMILAAPSWCGVLRIFAPAIIAKVADRRRFCIGAFLLSAISLLLLPLLASQKLVHSAHLTLWLLVLLWSFYHLFQYMGTVALWSWFADLVPLRIRGHFIGRRERWLVAGQAVAMLAGGWFHWKWSNSFFPNLPDWTGYAVTAMIGVVFFFLAVLPLRKVPRTRSAESLRRQGNLKTFLAPFQDARYIRLITFGCWFSLCNGISQSSNYLYPSKVLGIGLFGMLALKTLTRVGQVATSPWVGRLADRFGSRPVLLCSVLLTSQGPLFYYFASPEQWWWIIGAWVVWIGWVGINIGLPNLMLNLSPEESYSTHIATYFSFTGIAYAISTTFGGWLFDRFGQSGFSLGNWSIDFYDGIFLISWIARLLAVVGLLILIVEPASVLNRVRRRNPA
jgi:MFS family permease